MIKINLLPPFLRRRENIPKIPLSFIIFVVTLIIFSLHVVLAVFTLQKKVEVGFLNNAWDKMQPQFKEIDVLKNNLEAQRDKIKMTESVLKREVYFTDFFNKINKAVPKGLWLNRLSLSGAGLVIEGSVFSFGTDKVSLVNMFFNELKNDDFFNNNFSKFNLDSMQTRNIKEYEILDFLLTAQINKERFKIEHSN